MTKFRDAFLPVVDQIGRGLPNLFGLPQYDVSLSVVSWSGARPGLGTLTAGGPYALTVNADQLGNNRPKVVQVTAREVFASGGLYAEGDYRIGPLTPAYVALDGSPAGTLPSDVERLVVSNPQEVFFNLKGPGMSDPTGGDWFKLVEANFAKPFRYTFVIRKTAQKPF